MLRRRSVQVAALLCLVLSGGLWWRSRDVAESFQRDADVMRLQHLQHYGSLIEEYHAKTGRYPLQGMADVPLYVHIANDQQSPFAAHGPPTPHKLVSVAEFVAELEAGLGREVSERYDPQLMPTNKPNFYVYMVSEGHYFFAVHLHQSYPFAKKISAHYNKAEISDVANARNGASLPPLLFASQAFQSALLVPMLKPGFFAEREQQYESSTKRK